jgi:hypothetical protein
MPTMRKISSEQALKWEHEEQAGRTPTQAEIDALRQALPDPSGISRIDSAKRTHGWFVRVYGRGAASKLFSDRKYGGTAAALAEAIEWRDVMRERTDRE